MADITYIFCIYSILGWILETVFFYIKSGKFLKRGILHGAYCPLYGFSMAVCTAITNRLHGRFLLTFLLCTFICTAFELITAIIFDKMLNVIMWDYSYQKYSLNGYICPQFAIIWGVLGSTCILYLNPLLLSIPGFAAFRRIFSSAIMIFIIIDIFSFIKIIEKS